ncbi:hypothetical protein ACFPM7_26660 [Actinokineospora guangxiensis]|uniref:Uncharacterized protein n=1 Tax=Actinokineospora guangxiensis TaxID=1490288 RepID=A0ABW0ETM4_9PSEU
MRALTCGIAVTAVVVAGALPVTAAAATGPEYRPGRFTAATPVRLHDTRSATPVGPGATTRIVLGDRVPADATAVVLTLTVSAGTGTTVTPYAVGTPRSGPQLHLRAGEGRSAQVTIGLAGTRAVDVHNSAGQVNVIADLAGYYQPDTGAGFHGITPVRAASTTIPAKGTRHVGFAEHVPPDAVAVAVSITAEGTAATHLTAFPKGAARPSIGGLPLSADEPRTHFAVVGLGADRSVSLYQHTGTVDAVVDIVGFYTAAGGSAYVARTPLREYDSRDDYPSGLPGLPIPPRSRAAFSVAGSIPADATGVVLGVTAIAPTDHTALTLWADARAPRPDVIALSAPTGRTVSGTLALGVRPADLVTVYNSAGRTHVAVDLLGYFRGSGA